MSGYLQLCVDYYILIFILRENLKPTMEVFLFFKKHLHLTGFDFKLKPYVPWTAEWLR